MQYGSGVVQLLVVARYIYIYILRVFLRVGNVIENLVDFLIVIEFFYMCDIMMTISENIVYFVYSSQ